MLALLLCLSPAPQELGHAALHAADSELFFEIPSVGNSGTAIAHSPLVRAVTARAFREAVAAYVDIDSASPSLLLEQLLLETPLNAGERDAVTQCFVGLTAASVSLRGAQPRAVEILHEKRRVEETMAELRKLD